MTATLPLEDVEVYRELCRLHVDICELTRTWPACEEQELGRQVRESSSEAPARLAAAQDYRRVWQELEAIELCRNDIGATVHHLGIARMKGHIDELVHQSYRSRLKQCLRMLDGLERFLQRRTEEDRALQMAAG